MSLTVQRCRPWMWSTRSYAGLAYNVQNGASSAQGVETLNRKPTPDITAGLEKKSSARLDSAGVEVSPGLTSAAKWLTTPTQTDASFKVVSAGLGAVVMANIPANSQVFSAKNSALAFSPAVKHTRAVQGSTTEAISSTLKGGALLWDKFSTENAGGDLILAPRRIGDIASLTMDGTAEYYVRRDAFLAGTGTLLVSSSLRGFGLGSGGLFSYRVQGKGAIAISTYGGMFRLVLAPGEEYHVDPRHIVAWNASLQPEPADKSRRAISKTPRRDYGKTLRGLMPTNLSQRIKDMFTTAKSTPAVSTPAPTVEKMGQTSSTETISATTPPVSRKAEDTSAKLLHATGDVSKKMLVATGNIITRMACWVWKTTRQSLYGNQSYYTLRGPGDFYLSSRVEPSFGWLRDVQRKRPLKVSADSNATVTRDIKLPKQ